MYRAGYLGAPQVLVGHAVHLLTLDLRREHHRRPHEPTTYEHAGCIRMKRNNDQGHFVLQSLEGYKDIPKSNQ